MSDSLTVGVQQLQQLCSVRSSVPGVQAGTRGAKEGELGRQLQQQRRGSGEVGCATIGAWYLLDSLAVGCRFELAIGGTSEALRLLSYP